MGKGKKHRHQKKTTHSNRLRTLPMLPILLLGVFGIFLLLPLQATPVDPELEDMKAYVAKLELAAKKLAVQQTLPGKEEVLEVYDEPRYVQVTDTCNWQFAGDCVVARIGPGAVYGKAYIFYNHQGPVPALIRLGQVFPVSALVKSAEGTPWYRVAMPSRSLSFPGRIRSEWYIPAARFTPVDTTPINPEHDAIKHIEIVLHEQKLRAYEGDALFMEVAISTGRDAVGLATSTGTFAVYRKTPMKIMEGPLPGMLSLVTPQNILDFEYTLFVPYAMAFYPSSIGIAYIHEAYWHNGFGTRRSHGCVNLSYEDAALLYRWTPDPATTKTPVSVLP